MQESKNSTVKYDSWEQVLIFLRQNINCAIRNNKVPFMYIYIFRVEIHRKTGLTIKGRLNDQ